MYQDTVSAGTMRIIDRPLTIRNDGQLWVFFLGCGSAFSRRHYQTNVLIVKGDDHLLVDCGTTCSRALAEAGLSVLDIGNLVVTHSHADHIGGMEELMLMNRYVARKKPRLFITPGYERILWNQSLRGGAEMNERHDGRGLGIVDFFDVARPRPLPGREREQHRFSVGGISIRLFRTRHYPEQATSWDDAMYSVGLVIDERVVLSGDTQFDADLIETVEPAGGAEQIFQDAQFFTGGIHASLDELATLPGDVRRRMTLVHYGDNWEDQRERIAQLGFAGLARQSAIYEFDPSGE